MEMCCFVQGEFNISHLSYECVSSRAPCVCVILGPVRVCCWSQEYLAPEVINAAGHSAPVDWWSFGILIYELVYGTTPFRGARRDETFDNVLKAPLKFPAKPQVSPECQDLITQLLIKDPAKRLGTAAGAEDIKTHPFFAGINWALLRNEPPPYIPHRAERQQAPQNTPLAAGAAAGSPAK